MLNWHSLWWLCTLTDLDSRISPSSSSSYSTMFCILSSVPDVDVQLSHQCFGDRPGGLGSFGFPSFAIFASRSSSILFTWSPHAQLLILTHLMTPWISWVLRMSSNSIPQSIARILRSSFPWILVGIWWWLFPLLFQWRKSLQISHWSFIYPHLELMYLFLQIISRR